MSASENNFRTLFFTTALCLVGLSACQASNFGPTETPISSFFPTDQPVSSLYETSWWQPAPGTTWHWQLSGDIDPDLDVDMVDVDLFDTDSALIEDLHESGIAVVCYFSAGSRENWRVDSDQFPDAVLGKRMAHWPDERWLDIRQIDLLAPLMTARLDLAVHKGCDGVEADNADAYQNESGFPLTAQDQLDYNRWLADEAHQRGLSIGLKNDLAQAAALEPYFDWALNESCFAYAECEQLLPFVQAGKAVFGVEYDLTPDEFCPKANELGFSWMLKDRELDARGKTCWE